MNLDNSWRIYTLLASTVIAITTARPQLTEDSRQNSLRQSRYPGRQMQGNEQAPNNEIVV